MKKLICLVLAVMLSLSALSAIAENNSDDVDNSETKDYSYLEDMTVKELRELDAEIHKLLGDDQSASIGTESTEEVELTNADIGALYCIELLRQLSNNPKGLDVLSINLMGRNADDLQDKPNFLYYYHLTVTDQNVYGATVKEEIYLAAGSAGLLNTTISDINDIGLSKYSSLYNNELEKNGFFDAVSLDAGLLSQLDFSSTIKKYKDRQDHN